MFNPKSIENNFFHNLSYSFDTSKLKKGDMLISDPFLLDPNFSRSVILITEYSVEDGAVGFVLNKRTTIELSEVVESFYGNTYLFYIGGPVESDRVFYIHHNDLGITDSLQVTDNLGWSSNFEEARKLHDSGKLPPTEIKFFGGYCGWSQGQLEQEITEKSWIITNLASEHVLNARDESLWKQSLQQLGKKFSIMADFPENPSMN